MTPSRREAGNDVAVSWLGNDKSSGDFSGT
jgi:hypothetical protein